MEALLGPKTEADLAPPEPKKKVKAPAPPAAAKVRARQAGGVALPCPQDGMVRSG